MNTTCTKHNTNLLQHYQIQHEPNTTQTYQIQHEPLIHFIYLFSQIHRTHKPLSNLTISLVGHTKSTYSTIIKNNTAQLIELKGRLIVSLLKNPTIINLIRKMKNLGSQRINK